MRPPRRPRRIAVLKAYLNGPLAKTFIDLRTPGASVPPGHVHASAFGYLGLHRGHKEIWLPHECFRWIAGSSFGSRALKTELHAKGLIATEGRGPTAILPSSATSRGWAACGSSRCARADRSTPCRRGGGRAALTPRPIFPAKVLGPRAPLSHESCLCPLSPNERKSPMTLKPKKPARPPIKRIRPPHPDPDPVGLAQVLAETSAQLEEAY